MSLKSPTARTMAALRSEGWTVEVVEKWIPGAQIRRDLFGVIDVLAITARLPRIPVFRLAKLQHRVNLGGCVRENGCKWPVHALRASDRAAGNLGRP